MNNKSTDFEGKLIVFTAPSGAGKTTIVRHILQTFDQVAFSVSATTRPIREGEKEGLHYYFLSQKEFQQKIDNQQFVEYEEVYEGLFYGTLKSEIDRLWQQEKHVIFDIDVQGALRIKQMYPNQSLTIFVQPPSVEELIRRLRHRGTENQENIEKRIAKYAQEMKFLYKFDIRLVNDELDIALNEAENLVRKFISNDKKRSR